MQPPFGLPASLCLTDGGVTVRLTWDGEASAWWARGRVRFYCYG